MSSSVTVEALLEQITALPDEAQAELVQALIAMDPRYQDIGDPDDE